MKWTILISALLSAGTAPGCATRYFRVTESYTFESSEGQSHVFLGVMLPKSCEYQEVKNVKVTSDGPTEIEDHGFAQIAKLQGQVQAGHKTEAVITYDVVLADRVRYNGPVEPRDLQPQKDIESDHPAIIEKAKQLVSGKTREDVYKIYEFVGKHLSGPKGDRVGGSGSALKAYETGVGVCGEQANLFVALCRAAGIPARSVGGLALNRSLWAGTSCTRTLDHPAIAHGWAEFHTDSGWQSVDPTNASAGALRKALFGSHGFLLYYGEKDAEASVYGDLYNWVYTNGDGTAGGIGAMTAPYKFAAAAKPKDVLVTPEATVERLWVKP